MPKRYDALLRQLYCCQICSISINRKSRRRKKGLKPKSIKLFGYIVLILAQICLFLSTIFGQVQKNLTVTAVDYMRSIPWRSKHVSGITAIIDDNSLMDHSC